MWEGGAIHGGKQQGEGSKDPVQDVYQMRQGTAAGQVLPSSRLGSPVISGRLVQGLRRQVLCQ